MKLQTLILALGAAVEAASAAQLLICSDSTTANYALDDALQGYEPLLPRLIFEERLTNKQMGLLHQQLHNSGGAKPGPQRTFDSLLHQ